MLYLWPPPQAGTLTTCQGRRHQTLCSGHKVQMFPLCSTLWQLVFVKGRLTKSKCSLVQPSTAGVKSIHTPSSWEGGVNIDIFLQKLFCLVFSLLSCLGLFCLQFRTHGLTFIGEISAELPACLKSSFTQIFNSFSARLFLEPLPLLCPVSYCHLATTSQIYLAPYFQPGGTHPFNF